MTFNCCRAVAFHQLNGRSRVLIVARASRNSRGRAQAEMFEKDFIAFLSREQPPAITRSLCAALTTVCDKHHRIRLSDMNDRRSVQ